MRVLLVAALFLPLVAFGGRPAPLSGGVNNLYYYLQAYSEADGGEAVSDNLMKFVKNLEKKRASISSQKEFINYLFEKTHRRFLRSYANNVSFSQLLREGTYNCLTGTALYALLLDHFKVDYQIIETNQHIFILTETDSGQALFEATDPENGFVQDAEKIRMRIEGYRKSGIDKSDAAKTYFEYENEIYDEVSLDEMLALMHYNLSVAAYNKQDLLTAVNHLSMATSIYQSSRFDEYSRIVLLTIRESQLDPAVKLACFKRL